MVTFGRVFPYTHLCGWAYRVQQMQYGARGKPRGGPAVCGFESALAALVAVLLGAGGVAM